MKYILQRLCFKTVLLVGIIVTLTSMVQPVYAVSAENLQVLSDKTTLTLRMAEAQAFYRQAGLEEYFKDIAFLWSEPEKTRTVLRSSLVSVNLEPARRMGAVLWEVLQWYPTDPEALVMAGRYHDAMSQKDTARRHYHQALQVAPGYEPALLGLADGYLSENKPEQALKTLEGLDSPEVWLRKGIAHLTQGRYHLAVGYLIQAGSKPGSLEEVRLKDLAKAYRAVGGLAQVKQWLAGMVPTSRVGRVLMQDITISLAIMEGRFGEAADALNLARATVPEFYYWNFYSAWLQLLAGSEADIGPPMDPQLKSIIQVRQGQLYNKQGKAEEAYRSLNDALKTDKRSLIGYLEAGTLQWKRQNYNGALKLFSKGLEINPSFVPLLAKRAEIYEHLNQLTEAAADRAAISLALAKPLPFTVSQTRSESGTVYLNLRDTGKVLGIWFSEDGNNWSFTPWGRITPRRNATHVWLVPVGPGMTGSAARVELAKPAIVKGFPVIHPGYLELNLPKKGQVVVEQIGNSTVGASFVSERIHELQWIPLTSFGGNHQLLRVWYQLEGESWQTVVFQLNLPEKPKSERTSEIRPNAGLLAEVIPVPSISDFNYELNGGGYHLQWRSETGNSGWARVLTADGKWQQQAIMKDDHTGFTAVIPEQSRFCQLILVNEAGNTVIYTDPDFNEHLMAEVPVQFLVNGGSPGTSSRQVLITPNRTGLRWSISNDFRIWSGWFEGDAGSLWRIGAEQGRQVIFIRYQFREGMGEAPDIRYTTVFVDYRPE